MSEGEYDFIYKIVLVGDSNVGKTHLLSRYIKNTLPKPSTNTIGVEFATRIVPLLSGVTVKSQIWDTAGQERYRSIVTAHYRKAVGGMLVFDVSSEESFRHSKKWLEELRRGAEPSIAVLLIGNKVDVERQVTFEQAQSFAESENISYMETSALTGVGVPEAFQLLLEEIYSKSKNKPKLDVKEMLITRNDVPKKSWYCCC